MSIRYDMRQPGQSYTEGMFAQLDDGSQFRPKMTPPVSARVEPNPPVTTEDLAAFESLGRKAKLVDDDRTCLHCGSPLNLKTANQKREFCSRICYHHFGRERKKTCTTDLSHITDEDWRNIPKLDLSRREQVPENYLAKWREDHNKPEAEINRNTLSRIDFSQVTPEQWRTLTPKDIAKLIGCSQPSVSKHMRDHGLWRCSTVFNQRVKWGRITLQEWSVMTDEQVAETLGCTKTYVRQHRRRHNLPGAIPVRQRNPK